MALNSRVLLLLAAGVLLSTCRPTGDLLLLVAADEDPNTVSVVADVVANDLANANYIIETTIETITGSSGAPSATLLLTAGDDSNTSGTHTRDEPAEGVGLLRQALETLTIRADNTTLRTTMHTTRIVTRDERSGGIEAVPAPGQSTLSAPSSVPLPTVLSTMDHTSYTWELAYTGCMWGCDDTNTTAKDGDALNSGTHTCTYVNVRPLVPAVHGSAVASHAAAAVNNTPTTASDYDSNTATTSDNQATPATQFTPPPTSTLPPTPSLASVIPTCVRRPPLNKAGGAHAAPSQSVVDDNEPVPKEGTRRARMTEF
eukprot:5718439-Pyramimonas_sp.AAC.2